MESASRSRNFIKHDVAHHARSPGLAQPHRTSEVQGRFAEQCRIYSELRRLQLRFRVPGGTRFGRNFVLGGCTAKSVPRSRKTRRVVAHASARTRLRLLGGLFSKLI